MDKKILHQGTIHIPNLSEENSVSEIEVKFLNIWIVIML